MIISTLIQQIKDEQPNAFKEDRLVAFINEIEAQVLEDLDTDKEFIPYTYEDDSNKKLLVLPPYDKLYKSWVKAQIYKANDEIELYSNEIAQHNQDYSEWYDFAIRENEVVSSTPPRFRNIF